MNYTILIYETPEDFARRKDPARQQAYWGAWPPYFQALKDAGIYMGERDFSRLETSTTLRFQGDKRLVQDGPFADSKEQLGGSFTINVPDLDTALEWAAKCPHSPGGALEVRPNLPPMNL